MEEKKRFKLNKDEETKKKKIDYNKKHYDGSDELVFYDDDID